MQNLLIRFDLAAQIATETVFVQLFVGFHIPEAAALERRVKAFVQQYYRHLEQKDFTVE